MSKKIRLLYLNSDSATYQQIVEHLDKTGIDYLIEQTETASVDWGNLAKDKYDLVLLKNGPLNLREDAPLIILIIDGEDEESAVAALEQSQIADYVLNTSAGLQRLPFAIRAVLARNDNMSKT